MGEVEELGGEGVGGSHLRPRWRRNEPGKLFGKDRLRRRCTRAQEITEGVLLDLPMEKTRSKG